MRILIVTQYFWPEEFRINDLAISLKNRNHEVTVFTGIPNYPEGSYFAGYGVNRPRTEIYNGIEIVRFPLIPRRSGKQWHLILNYVSFALSLSLLSPFVLNKEFDLIFVYEPSPVTIGLPAILLKKMYKLPIIFWIQDLWPDTLEATGAVSSSLVTRIISSFSRWIHSECDYLLVQSRGYVPKLLEQGIDSDNIVYFPNWAEELFKPVESTGVSSINQQLPPGFTILFAGNIGESQAFDTIIHAAEILKPYSDIHWIVLGEGRQKSYVMDQVNHKNLNGVFHFLGRKPLETMPFYYSFADVCLVTLKKNPIFTLTVPGKLQSYLASGRPILAAIDGEGRTIIEQANAGLCAPAEDGDRLAELAYTMYKMDRKELSELGKNGLQYCKANFNKEMLIQRLEDLMMGLLS